jgi:hypothetical protein
MANLKLHQYQYLKKFLKINLFFKNFLFSYPSCHPQNMDLIIANKYFNIKYDLIFV